jgi:hypothetical protein
MPSWEPADIHESTNAIHTREGREICEFDNIFSLVYLLCPHPDGTHATSSTIHRGFETFLRSLLLLNSV